jgi:hypothetical protein
MLIEATGFSRLELLGGRVRRTPAIYSSAGEAGRGIGPIAGGHLTLGLNGLL